MLAVRAEWVEDFYWLATPKTAETISWLSWLITYTECRVWQGTPFYPKWYKYVKACLHRGSGHFFATREVNALRRKRRKI